MRKVFLYLYPIKEYPSVLTFSDEFYKSKGWEKPFDVLNECIQKRYRDKGYEVIFATYPDKEIYGINLNSSDKVINTNVTFKDASGYDENGNEKSRENIKYPSEEDIAMKVGKVDQIVIGGYHFSDCVKRVGEKFYNSGINTLIDLELTDLFFTLYRKSYFNKNEYVPSNYKKYLLSDYSDDEQDFAEMQFQKMYGSPIYHFENNNAVNKLDHRLEQKHK